MAYFGGISLETSNSNPTSQATSSAPGLVEYQSVANGPWQVGSTSLSDTGALQVRDVNGAVVTPLNYRISSPGGSSTEYQRVTYGSPSTSGILSNGVVYPSLSDAIAQSNPVANPTNLALESLSPEPASLQVLARYTIRPLQVKTTSPFPLTANGMLNVPTAGFEIGDFIGISQVSSTGTSERLAYLEVTGVPSATQLSVSRRVTADPAEAALGTVFNTDSEVTGQTRLPDAPTTGTLRAIQIEVAAPPAWVRAIADSSNPLYQLATVTNALAYISTTRPGDADIDGYSRLGAPLHEGGTWESSDPSDLPLVRVFSSTIVEFLPSLEVTYRGDL